MSERQSGYDSKLEIQSRSGSAQVLMLRMRRVSDSEFLSVKVWVSRCGFCWVYGSESE